MKAWCSSLSTWSVTRILRRATKNGGSMPVRTLLLAGLLVIGLVGCSNNDDEIRALQKQVADLSGQMQQLTTEKEKLLEQTAAESSKRDACLQSLGATVAYLSTAAAYLSSSRVDTSAKASSTTACRGVLASPRLQVLSRRIMATNRTLRTTHLERKKAVEPTPIPPSCDPNYTGACVPIVSYDLNCADIAGTVYVVGYDKHGFDGDGDGVGCE